jgi:hypothetical protein
MTIDDLHEHRKRTTRYGQCHCGHPKQQATTIADRVFDHWCELQEWKCYHSHHTGSGQDADSAMVAIRDNNDNRNKTGRYRHHRSGSAIVATTQEADSAMVAIRTINNYKSRQCQGDHRQQEADKTRDQASGPRQQQPTASV